MAFGLMEIDSININMRRDMPFLNLCLAIGGHLGNMQIKNCHWVKFSTPGGNDDSNLCLTQINQNFCINFQVRVHFANILPD